MRISFQKLLSLFLILAVFSTAFLPFAHAQEKTDQDVSIPVYLFTDQTGGVLGITPIADYSFLWVYATPTISTDTWGRTWTDTELADGTFRLKLDKVATNDTLHVDYLRVKAYYTAQVTSSTTVGYIHTDHLGGTGVVTDQNGNQTELMDYYPYGAQRLDQGTVNEQRKFTGHEYDSESDLTYANARYYNQGVGKWMSEDSAFLNVNANSKDLLDPQSLNSYAYARNNPIANRDPDGKSWTTGLQGFAMSVAVSAAVGIYIAAAPITLPATALTALAIGGFALTGYGTYSNYQSYMSGEISKDQFDYNAGSLLGPLAVGGVVDMASKVGLISEQPVIAKPYERPSYSTTAAQKQSVQGESCVTCGQIAPKMYADHKEPLVKEYYRTGAIDTNKMLNVNSVQPQCPSCSNTQGGQLSNYSKAMKNEHGF